MSETNPILDSIQVKSPCSANWAKMTGDDRARHCRACSLTVFNLSNMTRDEAETLVREKEGRLCVRFYRRADGTMITADCGKVIQKKKRRQMAMMVATATALFAAAFGADALQDEAPQRNNRDYSWRMNRIIQPLRTVPVVGPIMNRVFPMPIITMGIVCVTPPAPTTPPPTALMGEVYVPPPVQVMEAPPVI